MNWLARRFSYTRLLESRLRTQRRIQEDKSNREELDFRLNAETWKDWIHKRNEAVDDIGTLMAAVLRYRRACNKVAAPLPRDPEVREIFEKHGIEPKDFDVTWVLG